MPEETPNLLEMFTVYFNSADYPGMYVTRRSVVTMAGPIPDDRPLMVASNLADAQYVIPAHCVRLERDPVNDPAIVVEVWI